MPVPRRKFKALVVAGSGQGNSGGFSLVELLLVVAILSLLCGGAYEVYTGSTADARFQAMRAELKMLKTAIDQYRAKTGYYPSSLEALTRSYISRVPDDPTTERTGNDWMVLGPNDDPTDGTKWLSATSGPPPGGIADVRSSSEFTP